MGREHPVPQLSRRSGSVIYPSWVRGRAPPEILHDLHAKKILLVNRILLNVAKCCVIELYMYLSHIKMNT